MKTLTVQRMEGIYAICRDKDRKLFAIQISELPQGTAAGDLISVDDISGTLTVTKSQKKRKTAQ
ncbi:MAG: DUF3006 domain-containing protein [Oscillospiraceae bacterium]|jgi:hypothetical protein|nr:DUF3006 domain-containing protein [Oscillospiraceae bacterium]